MSRISKWKVEKTKTKVVFRLQFHATNIPQPGWDKLFISFLSLETGKVNAKTTKANVRNGSCNWPDPVYETTRLLQDTRTKLYDEKLYRIAVAMGTSRSNLLGEVNVNLAEFVDAFKPSSISLPLEECEFGTILHVTVQLLTSKTGFREFEKQRETGRKGIHMVSEKHDTEPIDKIICSVPSSSQINKVHKRFKSKSSLREFSSHEVMGVSIEDREDMAPVGIDGSSCTSESVFTDKSDNNSTPEPGGMNTSISGGHSRLAPGQTAEPVKYEKNDHQLLEEGRNSLSNECGFGYSIDNDLTNAKENNNRLRENLVVAESSISEFKMEFSSLQTLADDMSGEINNVVQQLAGEFASGKALTKEVSLLKSECLKLKSDLEELRHSKDLLRYVNGGSHLSNTLVLPPISENTKDDPVCHFPDTCTKLFNGFALMERKINEIRERAELLYHGKDIDILNVDFGILDSIVQSLQEVIFPQLSSEGTEAIHMHDFQVASHKFETISSGFDMGRDSSNYLQKRISDILNELEVSKIEQENLTKKMNQMENYYETLIHELEESHKRTLNELDSLKSDHSSCFYTISSFQVQIEKMHHDMNAQLSKFADERRSLNSLNIELERRANASETMLKKIRRNYSIAVDRLQRDLELLSGQVLSLFETNENLAKKAFCEASQNHLHELPYEHMDIEKMTLHNTVVQSTIQEQCLLKDATKGQPNEGLLAVCESSWKCGDNLLQHCALKHQTRDTPQHAKIQDSKDGGWSPLNDSEFVKTPIIFSEQESSVYRVEAGLNYYSAQDKLLLWDDESTESRIKSNHLLNDLLPETEDELYEMYVVNVCFEVFLNFLHETLCEKVFDIQTLKEEISKLSQQLDNTTESNNTLMLKLEDSTKNANILRENEAKCASECYDLTMRNHILQAKLHDVAEENSHLSERLIEYQKSVLEYKEFEAKYKICEEEKMNIEQLLRKESEQKTSLQEEFASIKEEYKSLKQESTNQSSVICNLEKTFIFVNEKLGDLLFRLTSCNKEISESGFSHSSLEFELKNRDHVAMTLHIEQCLQEAYKKILELDQEKKVIEREKHSALSTLNTRECSLEETTKKLHLTDANVQKLQSELDEAVDKLKTTSKAELVYAERCRELMQRNTILEVELEKLDTENKDISKSLLRFDRMNEELESANLRLANSMHEKENLLSTIQSNNQVSVQLQDAIKCLDERLKCADDEIRSKKEISLKLEDTIAKLNVQLNEKSEKLLLYDRCKTEVADLRLQISGMESHTLQLQKILFQSEECQGKLNDEAFSLRAQASNLEKTMIFVNEKLKDICSSMGSVDKDNNCTLANLEVELENKNYDFLIMHLKQTLEWIHEKICRQMQENEEIKMQGDAAQELLNDTASRLQDCTAKLNFSSACVQELQLQFEDASEKLKIRSEAENLHINENKELSSKITVLENELQLACSKNRDMTEKMLEFESIKDELEKAKLNASDCIHEREKLLFTLQLAKEVSSKMENEVHDIKEKLKYSSDELHTERVRRKNLEDTNSQLQFQLNEKSMQLLSFDEKKTETDSLRVKISEMEHQKSELQNCLSQCHCLQEKLNDEKLSLHVQVTKQENDIHILKEILNNVHNELHLERASREDLESRLSDLTLQVNQKSEQLLCFDEQKTELLNLNQHILDLESETSRLSKLLSCSQESMVKLETEISMYNSQISSLEEELTNREELLRSISDELLSERRLKEQLDLIVGELRSQLKDKDEQLLLFSERVKDFDMIRRHLSNLEAENNDLQCSILQCKESHRKLSNEKHSLQMHVAEIEAQISTIYESLLAENVKVIFIGSQFHSNIEIIFDKLNMVERFHKNLQIKRLNIIGSHQNFMPRKEENIGELQSTSNFEFQDGAEDKRPVDIDRSVLSHACNFKPAFMGTTDTQEQVEGDVNEKMRKIIPMIEYDVNSIRVFNDELDIISLVLRSKLNEHKLQLSLLESYDVELKKLREQNDELNVRLSEQILKAEEFKNLSIHLKEMKDKADAACLQVHEKKGIQGASAVLESESLRMAFIKEQCETEVLELRNQLHMSKEHGDELLIKLQNAIDEIEMRKKNEVVHCKTNEDLSKKVAELESDLQNVLSSRRESFTTYDEMKAELECSIISLDCCKEEKVMLESQLRASNEEMEKFRVELDLMKQRMKILISTSDHLDLKNNDLGPGSTLFGELVEEIKSDCFPNSATEPIATSIGSSSTKGSESIRLMKVHYDNHELSNSGSDNLQQNLKTLDNFNDDNLDKGAKATKLKRLSKEHDEFQEQTKEREILKSNLELLHDELEKMKNVNLSSLLPSEKYYLDPEFEYLKKELSQLSMANEHLSNMFPSFKKIPSDKNAMERVLALELELAEALQRKKAETWFQSSFLRQHSNEEAVFQSFSDINELIKDMLDIKGRHAAVEAELKEMHSRYSGLSLQLAEVEGERQKLIMLLKSRTPRRHKTSTMDSLQNSPSENR